jgi:hypothetical protein
MHIKKYDRNNYLYNHDEYCCGQPIINFQELYFTQFGSLNEVEYYGKDENICKKCLKVNIQYIICTVKLLMKKFNL